MKVTIDAHTDGKGYWTEEVRLVTINRIDFGYKSTDYYPEDAFLGELRAYFDGSGFGTGAWSVPGYGLIYTDKKWLLEFKKGLRAIGFSVKALQDLHYSEQGLQGSDYVSLDVGDTFYRSWKRLVKLGKLVK
jgi:hypothetical protein